MKTAGRLGARLDPLLLNASALTPGFKINASGSRNSADSSGIT